jgi:hypothetical protein
MAKAKTKAGINFITDGDPGDEHQPAVRRFWRVRMGEYPRLLVAAHDQQGAADAYRAKLGLRRLDLPTEVLPDGE